MKKLFWALSLVMIIGDLRAQTASFNFSLAPVSVSGWVNISGDPSTGVRSGTSNGITVSTVNSSYWVPLVNVGSAYDAIGENSTGFFPAGVLYNHWFQYGSLAVYNAAVPQLQISGLNKDSVYTVKMTGSSTSANITNPTQYTVAGRTVNGYIQVNTHNNITAGATFNNVAPDTSGTIRVYINTVNTDVADICGIQIIRGHTNPPPTVSITSPDNNDVLAEDGNIYVSALASEAGGSIVKVQFFVGDTTKIGEATAPPYTVAWANPDEGAYKITATAVDALGNSNSTSINVSVQSLSSFWSMTGNIGMNADSNFVGNVDSVRLAFRTKNIERMSISPTGNVGIGTITPTAALQVVSTNSGVLLPKLTNTQRNAIASGTLQNGLLLYNTDSSVFQYYTGSTWTSVGSGLSGARWQNAGGTIYDSVDNIAIGTSNPQGYKLAVNGTAIFTKVRVKPVGSWPDYVFKKGYALPSLKELELYITAHRHLPGMPSAEVVNREGQDLGENQSALLKKIEELTLYVIELNKKVEQLSRENEQMKKQKPIPNGHKTK